MDSINASAVCVDISVGFTPELSTKNEEFFTKEFLATFPTKHSWSTRSKDARKSRNSSKTKTTNGVQNTTEKSPRQERRNARERSRKARLNAAFQVLRNMVPQDLDSSHEQKKLTQVEILRLAKNYICSLTTILQSYNDNIAESYRPDHSSFCGGNFFSNMN